MSEEQTVGKIEVQGKVTGIIYRSPQNRWKIIKVRDKGIEFSAMGELFETDLGETLTFVGEWKPGKNGFEKGFHFDSAIRPIPTSISQIKSFLVNTRGIGPKTADKILDKFGAEFRSIIEKDPARITKELGIKESKVQELRKNWFDRVELRDLQMVLRDGGINSENIARRALSVLGTRAAEIVDDNPYRLVAVPGIGFKTADEMAMKKGWSANDIRRVDAAVSFELEEAAKSGHSFLNQYELVEKVQKLAAVRTKDKKEIPYPKEDAVLAIDKAVERHDIVRERLSINGNVSYLCYLPHNYDLEIEAAERIAALQSYYHEVPKNLEAKLKKVEEKQKLVLSPEQRQAVIDALKYNISILTGMPGTGKSTTTHALIQVTEELGLHVGLVAPTGRAAKRLSEITKRQATTIHRCLISDHDGNAFQFHSKNPLPFDLVIVDEASMLDLRLLVYLLRALKSSCSIVFIGDEHQLPSIGAGTVLKDMINSKKINTVVLSKIFRQAEGSLIIQNAHRIHKGEMPSFPQPGDKDADCYLIEVPKAMSKYSGKLTDDLDFIKEKLSGIYSRLNVKGFDPIKDVQILTPMKVGPAGYKEINDVVQNIVNPDGQRVEIGENVFRVGDRIMQSKNNYDLNVYNGDVGYIKEVNEESGSLVIDWGDRVQEYPGDRTKDLKIAYATTVHRFQGSECPVIIIILTSHHHIMLDRNLIYTANTRGRKMVIYLSSKNAIHTAVTTQHVLSRNSLLSERIRKQLKKDK